MSNRIANSRITGSKAPTRIIKTSSKNPEAVLRSHIKEGIKLIKAEKYVEAITHFENKEVAKKTGYTLEAYKNKLAVHPKERNDIFFHIELAAIESGFINKKRKIVLSKPLFYESWLNEHRLKKLAGREIALLFAEEWIHALQNHFGYNPVSSRGEEIQAYCKTKSIEKPEEIEVADYFLDQGISWGFLKETCWIDRYDRKTILTDILGDRLAA